MAGNRIPYELGNLRRSMVVLTFGPGSIIDFRVDGSPVSAIVAGLEEWDTNFQIRQQEGEQMIFEPRLQEALKNPETLYGFRLPPVVDEHAGRWGGRPDKRSLVAVRFPVWLQCPKCDRIAPSGQWVRDPGKAYRYCPSCTKSNSGKHKVHVIPVRFVMACEVGHLDEFPWDWWVNHKSNCTNRNNLLLKSSRLGLSGLIVSCPECKASRSMDGIFNAATWDKFKFKCNGRRPWLGTDNEICNHKPRVLQRGASNLYFPVLKSALSIPPWSDRLQNELGMHWSSIVDEAIPEQRAQWIQHLAKHQLKQALKKLGVSPEELANQIERRYKHIKGDVKLSIKQEEYEQFISGPNIKSQDNIEFEIRKVRIPEALQFYFDHIVRVVRLREVIAITGFTRINPPGDEDNDNDENIAHLSVNKLNWLPAIEVHGEGIFLALNTTTLNKWEKQDEVQYRADGINKGWKEEWKRRYKTDSPKPVITPRYLLIHTFAHALMRQLTLECGYSSASLRERLYVGDNNEDMAGLLIYTATSDSDGTLGGLQRQGEPIRISLTVQDAIRSMEWCSSDPLCIEGMLAASENHSLAACHACCLSPETSCEEYNRFLDRAMLIGQPNNLDIGFFSSMLGRND